MHTQIDTYTDTRNPHTNMDFHPNPAEMTLELRCVYTHNLNTGTLLNNCLTNEKKGYYKVTEFSFAPPYFNI